MISMSSSLTSSTSSSFFSFFSSTCCFRTISLRLCFYYFLVLFFSINNNNNKHTSSSMSSSSFFAEAANVECLNDAQCEEYILQGSKCLDGFCTNPFHYGGCLQSLLPSISTAETTKSTAATTSFTENSNNSSGYYPEFYKQTRVCGSDDPIEAIEKGYCRISPFQDEYMEIRILGQNWESAWFITWILQIVLTEILQVPVSVEGNVPGINVDFYNIHSRTEFDPKFDYNDQLVQGAKGDCRQFKQHKNNYIVNNIGDYKGVQRMIDQVYSPIRMEGYYNYNNYHEDTSDYVPCAHAIAENWESDSGIVQGSEYPTRKLGALGNLNIFVPKFTMERDPSLVTYTGLQGEQNRRKVAQAFKRPTTWEQYCLQVSEDNCRTPNNVTSRPPINQEEAESFFVEGLYTGHFRATEENDCDLNPNNCTGNIVDFPCGWGSYTLQQTHHLGIPLKSSGSGDPVGGYGAGHLPQIWAAANATKSDVMMVWFYPNPVYDQYIGTEAEMTRVILPPPTQECENSRAPSYSRCTNDYETNIGSPEGACDYVPQYIKKVVTETLYEFTHNPDLPEALWSPAYDFLANYEFSHLQLGEMFSIQSKHEQEQGKKLGDFSSRNAVCQFVVENFDEIKSFIPPTFPRKKEMEDINEDSLFVAALVFSGMTICLTLVTVGFTAGLRKTAVMYHTQTEFLFPLLFGFLFVAVTAWLLTLPPTDSVCVAIPWVLDIGYALQLFPLTFRIYTINRLSNINNNNSRVLQRVRLKTNQLFRFLLIGCTCVSTFLLTWMLVDPPRKTFQYEVTDKLSELGETIVEVYDSCSSEESYWIWISFLWKGFSMMMLGAILSLIAGTFKDDLNDIYLMSMVILTHTFFLVLMIAVWLLVESDESGQSDFMGYQSLILSADTAFSIIVYMVPKFIYRGSFVDKERAPDLFVNTSIMIADITGFTAWSSVREPTQVFMFLEELYEVFDAAAKKHKVYKVETVREQYVAATGIPNEQNDHAIVIVKFASECMKKMDQLVRHLEVKYGPDTSDMALRIGIHSGPVTGGHTKGKGGRFQLFGDTMTTTALIHSYSEDGRIHLSDRTADLLIKAGKKRWIRPRDSPIHTTTKGRVQTYWLFKGMGGLVQPMETSSCISSGNGDDLDLSQTSGSESNISTSDTNEMRWVDFNVEVLKKHLKQIVHRREARRKSTAAVYKDNFLQVRREKGENIPLDEVVEIISMPNFDKKVVRRQREIDEIELDTAVVSELKAYVTVISKMYNKNPFHNFAHASYVVMAIQKYLNRIIASSEINLATLNRERSSAQAALHEHTYGITSDPLTQFACVFSALIHDVDHPGVPNPRLVVEREQVVSLYRGRSVAEQKSFDLAWDVLMEKNFDRLRATICADKDEVLRFRQLVINSVMATDLGDKELKELRNRRWQKAFKDDGSNEEESEHDVRNRKATIVIEHLIQAADVAHMCQHWNIYRKWNQRLFEECYKAYLDGRADKNPADGWYEGELGFYDYYIIPLSEKLRDCGVFGPTSDENLNYARNNREMWEKEGKEIVAEMLKQVEDGATGQRTCETNLPVEFS